MNQQLPEDKVYRGTIIDATKSNQYVGIMWRPNTELLWVNSAKIVADTGFLPGARVLGTSVELTFDLEKSEPNSPTIKTIRLVEDEQRIAQ